MIEAGALQGVDRVIALHVDGTLEAGQIGLESGKVSGTDATFRATIRATGGHGATPHRTNDALWLTAQVINALYAVPARRVDPFDPAVVSLGIVRGGAASNVIPDSVYLEGTVRAMDLAVREKLLEEVEHCLGIARVHGADYTLEIERGYPPMRNDPAVVDVLRAAAGDLLGPERVAAASWTLGVEDFAYMTELSAGAMFRLGTRAPGGPARYVHTPDFDIDEDALPVGAAMLAETALRLLAQAAGR
jgi:amidohydrolase